jgi:hypothetical protein
MCCVDDVLCGQDRKAEKQFDFTMCTSYERARHQRLLDGSDVFLSPSLPTAVRPAPLLNRSLPHLQLKQAVC